MEKLICESECSVCGAKWEERNRLDVTSCGKLMCKDCEKLCKNYRKFMLPNGTHCMAVFEAEFFKYRLASMNIPAPPTAVKKAKAKYKDTLMGELFELLAKKAREYRTITVSEAAAEERIEMEAIRQIIYDNIHSDTITKHLYEILNSVTELRKSEQR